MRLRPDSRFIVAEHAFILAERIFDTGKRAFGGAGSERGLEAVTVGF